MEIQDTQNYDYDFDLYEDLTNLNSIIMSQTELLKKFKVRDIDNSLAEVNNIIDRIEKAKIYYVEHNKKISDILKGKIIILFENLNNNLTDYFRRLNAVKSVHDRFMEIIVEELKSSTSNERYSNTGILSNDSVEIPPVTIYEAI